MSEVIDEKAERLEARGRSRGQVERIADLAELRNRTWTFSGFGGLDDRENRVLDLITIELELYVTELENLLVAHSIEVPK